LSKILLVEDDEDSCEALAELLGQQGHNAVTAYTVDEGLRLARSGGFDLIILDNWFRTGNGIQLCRQIRMFDPETPVIFYSAAAYDTDIQAGLGAGANAYIVKPEIEEFQRAVNQLLYPY
jgi:DNA-binding response OmpR family regulator